MTFKLNRIIDDRRDCNFAPKLKAALTNVG